MSLEGQKTKARIIDGLLLGVIVVGALWFLLATPDSRLTGLVGKPAPAFKLRTMNGDVVGPPTYAGKVVLLDFWATWCNPCFRQMPAVERIAKEHPEDLVVLAVNVDDAGPKRTAAMRRFLAEAGVDMDSLMDDGAVQSMYGVNSIPTLVVIDPAGQVTYASSQVHSFEVLNRYVIKALETK